MPLIDRSSSNYKQITCTEKALSKAKKFKKLSVIETIRLTSAPETFLSFHHITVFKDEGKVMCTKEA